MESSVSVSVHPRAADGIEFRTFETDAGVSGFVVLRVPPGISLWFSVVADLDAVITAAVEARTWLAAELAGQPSLPANQTGRVNAYLTPGPLPVGVP
jgi:hypothetical protein